MIQKQTTLYPFHRYEACLWAAVGLGGALAVQFLACAAEGGPTWQKILLSSVAGPIVGIIVWLLQFPLRGGCCSWPPTNT